MGTATDFTARKTISHRKADVPSARRPFRSEVVCADRASTALPSRPIQLEASHVGHD